MLNFGDVKYALRLMLKRPGFTLLTVLVLSGGFSFISRQLVGARESLQQIGDSRVVRTAGHRNEVEWGPPLSIGHAELGSALEKQVDEIRVAAPGCAMHGRLPVCI
jgi:hypothetical protein